MGVRELDSALFSDITSRDADFECRRVQAENWGVMWAPETLAEFTRVVQRSSWRVGQEVVWRGQSQTWPIHRGAARRFRNNPVFAPLRANADKLESAITDYERQLINHARLDGHGQVAGNKRGDLEILALLQHHGAATRLVDFTQNAYLALWFAAQARVKLGSSPA